MITVTHNGQQCPLYQMDGDQYRFADQDTGEIIEGVIVGDRLGVWAFNGQMVEYPLSYSPQSNPMQTANRPTPYTLRLHGYQEVGNPIDGGGSALEYIEMGRRAYEVLRLKKQIRKLCKDRVTRLAGEPFFVEHYYRVFDNVPRIVFLFHSMASPPPVKNGVPRRFRMMLLETMGDYPEFCPYVFFEEEFLARTGKSGHAMNRVDCKYIEYARRLFAEHGAAWAEMIWVETHQAQGRRMAA